jgi:hypothetical protein
MISSAILIDSKLIKLCCISAIPKLNQQFSSVIYLELKSFNPERKTKNSKNYYMVNFIRASRYF